MKHIALLAVMAASSSVDGIKVVAVGDNLFARYQDPGAKYRPVVKPGVDPYAFVKDSLSAGDLTFGNVECPIMEEPDKFTTFRSLVFRCEPAVVGQLTAAGFDVVSIANNHMNNMGKLAPATTRRTIEAGGLRAVGAGANVDEAYRPAIFEVGGKKVAFLAFAQLMNGGAGETDVGAIAYAEPKDFMARALPAVVAARRYLGADFVLVSIHWGAESQDHPDGGARKHARALIAAGADVILGHHPHVIQDMERWRGGLIIYSMGNFLFDAFNLTWRQSMIVNLTLEDEGALRHVGDVLLEPVMMHHDDHRPKPVTGREYAALRKRIERLCPGFAIVPEAAPPLPP